LNEIYNGLVCIEFEKYAGEKDLHGLVQALEALYPGRDKSKIVELVTRTTGRIKHPKDKKDAEPLISALGNFNEPLRIFGFQRSLKIKNMAGDAFEKICEEYYSKDAGMEVRF